VTTGRILWVGLFVGWAVSACGPAAPAPSAPRDASVPDLASPPPGDGGGEDIPGVLDGGVLGPDGGSGDAFVGDGGDAGTESDGGVVIGIDDDGDTISNVHEGRGAVDTDGDGTPDHLDTDSDDDGIPDRLEAGDGDWVTPPRDHDRDLTPDYRDLDADDDGILDAVEGSDDFDDDGRPDFVDGDADDDDIPDRIETAADLDGDGNPNYRDLDSDSDGIADALEGALDADGDGAPNFVDLDADGDGIADAVEGTNDVDRDQVPNFLDLDSDGDGLPDAIEGDGDADGDDEPNFVDVDADGDGIRDAYEAAFDPDDDGIANFLDLDADGDGISDAVESQGSGSDEPPPDTDVDGVYDFLDVDADGDFVLDTHEALADHDGDLIPAYIDFDSDGDALLDVEEVGDEDLLTPPVDTDGDLTPDLLDLDSDGDGILDFHEGRADSDADGVPDRLVLDADADGFSDTFEAGDDDLQTPPIDTDGDGVPDFRDLDADDDGLIDASEHGCPTSTDRLKVDSDGDSYQDAAELAMGSSPCDASSAIEAFYFVLPDSGSLDSDTLVFDDTEVDEADVVFSVDTTGSMGGEITNLRSALQGDIVPGVEAAITAPAFAVSSFQDYPVAPFGSSFDGDVPFSLDLRVSTDTLDVQSALNALATKNGEDVRESGLEALYQIATGHGTRWGSGAAQSVDAFDPSLNRIAGVADGEGGGVGFRADALPIVVHVTDAPSHLGGDYDGSPSIEAALPTDVRDAIATAGVRVLAITGEGQPRPWTEDQLRDRFGDYCAGTETPVFGLIEGPRASDADWFELTGAASGQLLDVVVSAHAVGSALDPMVAVYDANGAEIDFDDDGAANGVDAELTGVALSGPAPYYVAVSAYNDVDFNGSGAVSAGHYFLEIDVAGARFGPSRLECSGVDAGDSRAAADTWGPWRLASVPGAASSCEDDCWARVEDEAWRAPYGIARATGASVPACAWDEFGNARPAACAAGQCCTGKDGAGQSTSADGACPLSFEISESGAGIGDAVVTGIEALVNFSEFTISARVRGDDDAAIDTACFIQRVTPVAGAAPNTCAPAPVAADTSTKTPGLDSFESVVPGSVLDFEVVAANLGPNGQPCASGRSNFRVFRAYIDVIADGVAKLATRDVVIVVPPAAPTTNQ
jgi:hypothetical protein